jgi:hypothetical protein
MQIAVRNRDTVTGVVTVYSTIIDVSNMPLLTLLLIVHAVSGTGPNLAAQVQTSDDLESWSNVGSALSRGTAGQSKSAVTAETDVYGRYIRVEFASTGTSPLFNFSFYVNAFPST